MGAFLIFSYWQNEQTRVGDAAISRARAVTSAVDRQVGITQAALHVLATSPLLTKSDLAGFHAQAEVALPTLDAETLVLVDRTGPLRLSTSHPWGTPLPQLPNPSVLLQHILKTGKPGLSDLFLGPISGKLIYIVGVPVTRDGSIVYSLNASASPTQMLKLLSEQKLPDNWRAAIIDSSGSIVARTHEMDKFLGSKATPDLLQRMSAAGEGSFVTLTLEGTPNVTAYSRSALTGWTVAIGAPVDELNEHIRLALTQMLAAALIALVLGLMLASVIGGRIAAAFVDLIKPARALGSGQPVVVPPLPIKEANEVAEALSDAARLLEQANRAKAEFISRMSHELRTPLNAILGFAQLMEAGSPPPTPSQTQSLKEIVKAGWNLLDQVNVILDYAMVESGKAMLSQEPVSLVEVMSECKAMIEPLAKERGISLAFPQFTHPWFVLVDRSWIKQCLMNLLSNAIRYNKPNGVVAVECELSSSGSIRIRVRDTGDGLSADQLAQLFQPFSRLGKELSADKGAGISLAVTKRLVELMGGSIGVDSTVGTGSVFWIELSLATAP
ncbi:MAG: sensor histidine kinase [Sulfuritalea sp.]|nr:sensor histidine kinase [Sulfuritalea sp.]